MDKDSPHIPSGVTDREGLASLVIPSLVFAMIFFQKLGVTINEGSVGFNVALLWFGLGVLALTNQLVIDVTRLAIFSLLIAAMSCSMALGPEESRWSAFAIFVALFAAFVFRVPATVSFALRSLRHYQSMMVAIAGIVILQQALQFAIGPNVRLSLEDIIPDYLLYPGFAYIRPIAWNSPYVVPNGFFFLEPSTVSGYLAAALVTELAWFRNHLRIVIFGVALLVGMALTGLVAIIITMPFWIWRAEPRTVLALVFVVAPLAVGAFLLGWLDPLLDRADELSTPTSSAYARLVNPAMSIASQIGDPAHWIFGSGAGSSEKGADIVQWPFSKLLHEYGLATAVLFHIFLLLAVLRDNHLSVVTIVFLVPYLFFGGGFVAHASVMPLLLLGPLFLVSDRSLIGRGFQFGEVLAARRTP